MGPVLRIALAEIRRHTGRVERRGMIAVGVLGLMLGAAFAFVPGLEPQPEADLYTVEVSPGSPLGPAAESAMRLRAVEGTGALFEAGRADMFLVGTEAYYRGDDDRSLAAMEAYQQELRLWLDRTLGFEPDDAAAFPLEITVVYEARVVVPVSQGGNDAPPRPEAQPTGGTAPEETPSNQTDLAEAVDPAGEIRRGLRPGEVDPPFPIRSLLLTFAYLLPASLLAQVHAANLHAERVRNRGVQLLVSPIGPVKALWGRSLPALGLSVLIGVVVSFLLGAGIIGFLASLSFLFFLFAATTWLALVARSPRELTLHQVAMTTLLNTFLFLPAMFPALPPVAFLSPVHVVAASMRGEPIALGPFLYATIPLTLSGVALAILASGYFRDEILFGVRSASDRFLDATERISRSRLRTFLAGVLVVPFVFAGELVVLVTTAVLGLDVAFALFLPLSVTLEEFAKGLPLWARARHAFGMPAWMGGALIGAGFFAAEKGALILTLVGFRGLPYGDEALALLGTGPGALLLMLPLALHVVTAVMIAVAASKGKVWGWLGFLAAILVHLGYDQLVLRAAT